MPAAAAGWAGAARRGGVSGGERGEVVCRDDAGAKHAGAGGHAPLPAGLAGAACTPCHRATAATMPNSANAIAT